jgi:hypothetical protein
MEAVHRSESVRSGRREPLRDTARGRAWTRHALIYAAVSAVTFAAYAITVSAAGAPPSVHAAGLLLWVAHVVLLFGRTPSLKSSSQPELRGRLRGDLARAEALDRAADAAASLSVTRDRR